MTTGNFSSGVCPPAGKWGLTSTWDQNAALYATAPAEAVIEEACGAWLKDLLGLPPGASFSLVTGSQMAHATCLAAARHALLGRLGWDVERKGLSGAPGIRILTSGERHGSIDRAVRLLGLGLDSVVELPVNDAGSLSYETPALALGQAPGAPCAENPLARQPEFSEPRTLPAAGQQPGTRLQGGPGGPALGSARARTTAGASIRPRASPLPTLPQGRQGRPASRPRGWA